MSPNWIIPFLEQLRIDGNVSRAARVAGISSTTAYALRKEDGGFAMLWQDAHEDAGDNLIAEARRRAVDGINEPVVYQGQLTPIWERDANGDMVYIEHEVDAPPGLKDAAGKPVKTVKQQRPVQARAENGELLWLTLNKKSDALLTLLLKGYKKTLFADRTELTGADGAPVEIDATTRRARLAAILAKAQQRKDFSDIA